MEKDILSRVIEVEKEIQERLISERRKAAEWLEKVKREAEEEVLKEDENLKMTCEKMIGDAEARAEKEAAEITGDAASQAGLLSVMSDETLEKIVMKHISSILPAKGERT